MTGSPEDDPLTLPADYFHGLDVAFGTGLRGGPPAPPRAVGSLTARRAVSEEDFEAVRRIRNAGRHWFDDSHVIDPEEQAHFRETCPYPVWVYEVGDEIVGWGLVKQGHAERAYVSVAVALDQRGHGYGTRIYSDLRARTQVPLWATCRVDNSRSIRAALAAGFRLVEDDDPAPGMVTLRCG